MARAQTMNWQEDTLYLLDQRRLPLAAEYKSCKTVEDVAEAIRNLTVRGASAIGAAAAYGMVLAALQSSPGTVKADLERSGKLLAGTRPTAVNLFWAIKRMLAAVTNQTDYQTICQSLRQEAAAVVREDVQNSKTIGRFGAALLPETVSVLTICNAGALAGTDYGTALGVIRAAKEAGKHISVYALETRPVLQGARLTAWELLADGLDVTLLCDNMAGCVMAQGKVDAVIAGADRIAANGDTANKIGTYSLAVLAKAHQIPFYIAAPTSSIDLAIATGKEIVIEERPAEEVTHLAGRRIAPENVKVYNPAFDVTPAQLISAVITERGVFRFPYEGKFAE
jgi:methylthioribose-1-phosphate isomerase